jgi:hypothetical protein
MFQRIRHSAVGQWLAEFPAVALLGPRQVGKTTLALEFARGTPGHSPRYLDLELPADLARLADPQPYLESLGDALVVIDEVQRLPTLFPVLRSVIDKRRRAGQRHGQFLLLGSANGALLSQSAESLAGRIAYCELDPLCTLEVPAAQHRDLWVRGGYPDSLLAAGDAASLRWRQQFIATYLERDIPQLSARIPAATLRRFWTMLAHHQGQLLNAAQLAAALAVSGQTVARYLDLLVDLMLVRRLPPWAGNTGKRLTRSPKVYVRDSGLVHALLGLATHDDVLGHPVAGASWEGFVIDNLLAVAPPGTAAWFFRSAAGAEIDLVLEPPGQGLWAIEVKRSSAPSVARGFHTAADDLHATQRLVVYPGDERFPLGRGIEAVPLVELQRMLAGIA